MADTIHETGMWYVLGFRPQEQEHGHGSGSGEGWGNSITDGYSEGMSAAFGEAVDLSTTSRALSDRSLYGNKDYDPDIDCEVGLGCGFRSGAHASLHDLPIQQELDDVWRW